MEQLMYSAALYCESGYDGHVSAEWLESIVALFKSYGLPVREYGIVDQFGALGGPYVYRDNDSRLYKAARTSSLLVVDLLCHSRKRRALLMNWEGAATINLREGYAHLGLPAACGVSLVELLRRSYTMAKPIAPWRYGIGYSRSSLRAPCMYAVGIRGGAAFADPSESDEERDRIGCWFHELRRARRHLQGYFRDVYPANLLSAAHVNVRVTKTKTLLKAGWGEFTPIDDGLWLWTVPEEDIPKARAALIRAKVLLCP